MTERADDLADGTFDWGAALPTLLGERLELRWITQDDVAEMFEIFGDPEVIRYWSSPALPDLDAAQRLVEEIHGYFAKRELFQWGICPRAEGQETEADGRIVGTCTLLDVDHTNGRAEIGFALGRRSWGRGLASEAVTVLLRFAFETLGLRRIEADVDPHNARSLQLLERQGFKKEGLLRERWLHLGTLQDAYMLGLLRREWTAS